VRSFQRTQDVPYDRRCFNQKGLGVFPLETFVCRLPIVVNFLPAGGLLAGSQENFCRPPRPPGPRSQGFFFWPGSAFLSPLLQATRTDVFQSSFWFLPPPPQITNRESCFFFLRTPFPSVISQREARGTVIGRFISGWCLQYEVEKTFLDQSVVFSSSGSTLGGAPPGVNCVFCGVVTPKDLSGHRPHPPLFCKLREFFLICFSYDPRIS